MEKQVIPKPIQQTILKSIGIGCSTDNLLRYWYYLDAFNFFVDPSISDVLREKWGVKYNKNKELIENIGLYISEYKELEEKEDFHSMKRKRHITAFCIQSSSILIEALSVAICNSMMADREVPHVYFVPKAPKFGEKGYWKQTDLPVVSAIK